MTFHWSIPRSRTYSAGYGVSPKSPPSMSSPLLACPLIMNMNMSTKGKSLCRLCFLSRFVRYIHICTHIGVYVATTPNVAPLCRGGGE